MSFDDGDDSGWDGSSGYRWTCPVCGKSQTNYLCGEGDKSPAVEALRAHIWVSADGDHGGAHAFPPDFDVDSLADHVVKTE